MNMRRRTLIEIYNEEDRGVLEKLQTYFSRKGMNTNYNGGPLEIRLYADTPEFELLIAELEKRGLKYDRVEVREYTKKDLEQSELFQMILAFPYESDGEIPNYGTTYERSCPDCDIGLIQTSDLIVNAKRFSKYDIATLEPEILINEKLRILLEENQITGYDLRTAIDFKSRTDLLLHQLVITNVLPEMSEYIRVDRADQPRSMCKTCGRNGIIRRSEAIYEREKLAKVCDLNVSKEFFGINMYCVQDIIVTQKLYKLFKENRIKRMAFDPVSII